MGVMNDGLRWFEAQLESQIEEKGTWIIRISRSLCCRAGLNSMVGISSKLAGGIKGEIIKNRKRQCHKALC
jgi:hypothetical protein